MFKRILMGGLVAGILDILYAFTVSTLRGGTPMNLLQSVAAGVYGPATAHAGGWGMALQGLLFHMIMATIMAAVFVAAYDRLKLLQTRTLLWGLLYGLGLLVVMRCIVVPLSAIGVMRLPQGWLLVGAIFTHTVFVGLPIAYYAQGGWKPKAEA